MKQLEQNNDIKLFSQSTNIEKKELMELLKDSFLTNYVNLYLTEQRYNTFDNAVKRVYNKIGYAIKSISSYGTNDIGKIFYETSLDTISFGNYLLYIAFKTKDEQFGYFYIGLFEGINIANFKNQKGLIFSDKNEFLSFIKNEVINNFFSKIDNLEEVKISIGKKEGNKPINNTDFFKLRLAA